MKSILTVTLALIALAASGRAQTTTTSSTGWGPDVRSREFTLGGAGAFNKDLNDSFGGVNFSFGIYTTPMIEWSLRQSILYANPSPGGTDWNGSTRIAFDYHIAPRDRLHPFVGANFGGIYGDSVRDTFAAGLETGAKFYVQQRTFIFGVLEYAWAFSRASRLDNNFSEGQFNWSTGIGFNF
jgi:hypothetical protein